MFDLFLFIGNYLNHIEITVRFIFLIPLDNVSEKSERVIMFISREVYYLSVIEY